MISSHYTADTLYARWDIAEDRPELSAYDAVTLTSTLHLKQRKEANINVTTVQWTTQPCHDSEDHQDFIFAYETPSSRNQRFLARF
jgi:hypothetical protein